MPSSFLRNLTRDRRPRRLALASRPLAVIGIAAMALVTTMGQAQDGGGTGGPGVEPVPFEGCGVLQQTAGADGESDCFTFITHNGRFLVENVGEFTDGDPVCVMGEILPSPCGTDGCGELNGCIINNVIFEAFEGYGSVLIDGGDCGMFETVSGQRYQVAGGMPVGFSPGDEINVVGSLNFDCVSLCEVPCVEMPNITPGYFTTGTIHYTPGGGCPVLLADDGEVLFLENGGQLAVGTPVYVSGRRRENTPLCSGVTLPGLEENLIRELTEVCGEIQVAPHGCWYLENAEGESFLITDIEDADLEDLVLVTGYFDAASNLCPESPEMTIRVVRIDRCAAGDVNRDGVVDIDDLIAILVAWGSGDEWADLNRDGIVNVDDLVTSLLNWG